MLIAYARVSTLEQSLDLQTDVLKGAGCEKLFTDEAGGAMSPRDVAQNLGVSIPTLYRWVPASSR